MKRKLSLILVSIVIICLFCSCEQKNDLAEIKQYSDVVEEINYGNYVGLVVLELALVTVIIKMMRRKKTILAWLIKIKGEFTMKKIVSLLMAIVICVSLCSCNNNSEKTQTGYSDAGEFPIVDEPVELTVWAILSSDIEDYSTNYQSEWYEEYSGVTIHWINVPSSGWADAFQTSVMSGEYPDIYLYDFATAEVEICAEYNAIIPLDDLIEEHCPNVKSILDNDAALKKSITSSDGHIYTLFTESYNISAFTQKLWVNKQWLETYKQETGKGMPDTTEEFKEMLMFFRDNDMNGNGDKTDEIPFMGVNGVDGVYNLAGAFVPSRSASEGYGCYLDENNQIKFAYNTDEFREAIKYVADLYSNGCFSDQSFTIDDKTRYNYTSGKASGVTVGVATGVSASSVVELYGGDNLDYSDYVAIPPLEGPDGVRTITSATGENSIALKNAITTACEYPEIAAKWLDYWYSEEGRLWAINGGIENEHWSYEKGESADGKGKIVVHSDEVEQKTNFCWSGKGVNYALTEEDLGHMDVNELGTNNYLATYLANLEYRPYSVDLGWPALVWAGAESQEAIEYSELCKLVKNHVETGYSDFILGNKDIHDDDEWDEYVKTLDDIGVKRYEELVKIYIDLGQ